MIDRKKFFDAARAHPFNGDLTQGQVDGMNALIDGFEKRYPGGDKRWLAYFLATAFWETAHTMQPVREAYWFSEQWRKDNLRYYPFYGRGYVQLTWDYNYKAMSAVVGLNLSVSPDLALIPATAAQIMFYGMEHGSFGGGGIAHWFNATTDDPEGARHLVNGTDHAADIAVLHRAFLAGLVDADERIAA